MTPQEVMGKFVEKRTETRSDVPLIGAFPPEFHD
jgi:hypothetical protein